MPLSTSTYIIEDTSTSNNYCLKKFHYACPCRHTSGDSQSAMVTATSEVLQQLQQDKKIISKDFIELYKVIGHGKYLECGMCNMDTRLYPASVGKVGVSCWRHPYIECLPTL